MKCIVLLLNILVTNFTISDELELPPGVLEEHVFNTTPKIWFRYIEKFGHNFHIKFNRENIGNLIKQLNLSIRVAKTFGQKAIEFIRPHVNQTDILNPSGTLVITGFVWIDREHRWWAWNLHQHFGLNLTIYYIYFSSDGYNKCYFGSLHLENEKEMFKMLGSSLFYCGIHPMVHRYFSCSVNITLFARLYVSYATNMTFCVIRDTNRIISWKPTAYNLQKFDFTLFLFCNSMKTLHYFSTQIQKYKTITMKVINLAQSEVQIYDGPGVFSGLLRAKYQNLNGTIYQTSTFQCVIYWLMASHMNFSTKRLSYLGVRNVFYNMALNEDRQRAHAYYPDNQHCKQRTVCILRVNTQLDVFVKIEITTMSYVGPNSTQCRYAGLTVYDPSHTTTELSSFCESQSDEYNHRNTYSSSNSLLIVLYTYARFVTSFASTLYASRTRCRAVSLDVCQHRTFLIYGGDCQTVQLHVGPFDYATSNRCVWRVRLGDINEHGKVIHLNVTGFFRSFYPYKAFNMKSNSHGKFQRNLFRKTMLDKKPG